VRDHRWTHEQPDRDIVRTIGRAPARARPWLVALGVVALGGCGEIVPIHRDGGPVIDAAAPDAVAADNADLAALDLGAFGDVVPAFAPTRTAYTASFSLLVQRLQVTATPVHPGATLSINGTPVAPGRPAGDIALAAAGETSIEIEVRAPAGNRKTYRVAASRSAPIRQWVYGKASNPGAGRLPRSELEEIVAGDEFGFWMDISGDTLVVGAHLEDSSARGIDGDQHDERAPGAGAAYVFRRRNHAWAQEAYLKASNTGAGDDFGRAVAIDGDVIAVGAPFEASDASGIDGDQDSNGLSSAGAVYVFRRSGDQWRQEAYLKPSSPRAGALFGLQVALARDVLVVGAPGMVSFDPGDPGDDTFPNQGTAYVFRHTDTGGTAGGATWVEEAILTASSSRPGDQLGFQLDIDGDTIAVSAIGEAGGIGGDGAVPGDVSAPMAGAVYVFERQQDGAWRETDYVKPRHPDGVLAPFPACSAPHIDGCEGDRFGIRVELDGDTMVVGGHLEDGSARAVGGDETLDDAHDAGAAWVFRREPGGWVQEAYLKPGNLDAGDFFGQNFALAGDLLAVAANGESSAARGVGQDGSDNDARSAGAVYLFRRENGAWQQIEYIKASNAERLDNFGFNVAMSSSTLVVGALWESGGVPGINGDPEDGSAPASGAFYIFQ
jgi:hypothetical protein